MPDKALNDRIAYYEKRLELLNSAVSNMQRELYQVILEQIDGITTDPAVLDKLFQKFTNTVHAKVIQQFASDILSVGKLNNEYFKNIGQALPAPDFKGIKKKADQYLLNRFGLTAKGKMIPDGFISTFIDDTSIKRQLKEYAYKSQLSGVGLKELKKGFKEIITGTPTKTGVFERYYQQWAYNTYQQADACVQDIYAKELGLQAAIYLGGTIKTTRPHCLKYNDTVLLRSEIAAWKDLEFSGKPDNYDPFIDRGGHGCRHHYGWITNKMAIRRRPDLEEDENGKLRVKKGASENPEPETTLAPAPNPEKPKKTAPPKKKETTEAKTTAEAEKYALDNKFAEKVNFGKSTPEQANDMNSVMAGLHSKYKLNPLSQFSVEVPTKGGLTGTANGHYQVTASGQKIIRINQRQLNAVEVDDYAANAKRQLAEWKELREKEPWHFEGNSSSAVKNRKAYAEIEEATKFEVWTVRGNSPDKPYKSTLVHEFGHKIHDDISGAFSSATRKTNLLTYDQALALNREMERLYEKSIRNGDIYKISAYSKSKVQEFFAESFTMYELHPEKLPKDVKTFLEKYLSYVKK